MQAKTQSSFLQTSVSNNTGNFQTNLHTWTQDVMIEVIAAMDCQLTGIDPINAKEKCLGINEKSHQIGYATENGGLLGVVTQGITFLYMTPVTTTHDYISYVEHSFGLSKPAYAAASASCNPAFGIGFCGLSPLTQIWSIFRDFVYLLFAFVFVVVGLGIMLRVKIDPRTVMSVQNQIPKIIISLILVTFSLAIAGLLVDLMYVVTAVVLNLFIPALPNFANTTGGSTSLLSMNSVESQNVIGYFMSLYSTKGVPLITGATGGLVNSGFWNLWIGGANAVSVFSRGVFPGEPWDSILGFTANGTLAFMGRNFGLGGLFQLALSLLQLGGMLAPVGLGITGNANLGALAQVINWGVMFTSLSLMDGGSLGSLIGLIIIPIALLLALFRILISLIKAYIGILLKTALAPFIIVMGVFPGENNGFIGWLKGMVADLAIFPVTLFLLLLGEVFTTQFGNGPQGGVLFVPPLIGASNPAILGPMISLGILFIIPNASQLISEAIKAPQNKALGGVGKSLGAGNPMSMLGQVSSIGYTMSTLGTMPVFRRIGLFEKMAKNNQHFGHQAVGGHGK